MLQVQQYLQSKSLDDLTNELGIKVQRHDTLPLCILNYDQIESPKTNPVVRECRGLVLRSDNYGLVAKSFNRFFNWGEVQEEMALFDFSDFQVQEKVDGCFLYNTKLNLWGGGTIKIGDIVSKRLTPTLIGVNEVGDVVPCTVTDWHDNGTKDNWIEITTTSNHRTSGHPNRLVVTDNHAVFVNGEFRPALVIRPGDTLKTFTRIPCEHSMQLIEAALLGDGSIVPNGNGWKFVEGHRKDHNYAQVIHEWLGECAISLRSRTSGYGTKMLDASSKSYTVLKSLRDKWYPDGKKLVPQDLSWIDDFAIAKWYMDDGHLVHDSDQQDRAAFATHGFSEDDVKRLANKLQSMYGVNAVVAYSKGWYIRVNYCKGTIERFWSSIAPHIHPCMRRKLPEKYRSDIYIPRLAGKELATPIESVVVGVKKIEITKNNFPFGRKGFDITTTTGNYFAKGTLVHNSLVLIYNFEGRWLANTRGSFAQDKMQGLDFTWQEGFCKAMQLNSLADLDGRLKGLEHLTFICEFCSPWNKVVRRYQTPVMFLLTMFDGEQELTQNMVDAYTAWVDWNLFQRPISYAFRSIEEIQDFLNKQAETDPTYEGVVICDKNGWRWKIKSATYLGLHRLKGEGDNLFHPKHLLPFVLAGETDELLTYFPEVEETYKKYETMVKDAYDQLEQVWAATHHIEAQKDFALAIVGKTPFTGLLFNLRKEHGPKQTQEQLKRAWRNGADAILKHLFKK